MSAIFNFESLLTVVLLLICACTYIHAVVPSILDRYKVGFTGIFWKCARIGERKALGWLAVKLLHSEIMSLFPDLSDAFEGPQEIESLCMQCYKNGVTKLLLTKIPFFKEVIISSFKCEHCGFSNNEVQPGSAIQPKGVRYTVTINDKKLMDRQVVKQASAMFRIEELDFEGPAFTSQGALTTIEGLFENAIAGLQQQQQLRMIQDPDLAKKIDEVINKLNEYKTGDIPFTLIVEDISGNSFVENPYAPNADPFVKMEYFKRSKEHNEQLGLNQENEDAQDDEKEEFEVLEFQTNCSSCNGPAPTRMKQLDIPHFKQVIIMATTCDACGKKTNEVRAGGAIEELGTRITFRMTDPSDLNRDVLTSESCTVSFPHLEMEFRLSSSGGKFTTLEGLLYNVLEHLGTISPFSFGDSAVKTNRVNDLVETIHKVIEGKEFITIVLDDPVGNSYLQNIYAPDPDPEITIEKYERTQDQNDQYGLSDMKTENYMNNMRNYKRTSNRQTWSESAMQQAFLSVINDDKGYKKAAKVYSVPQTVFERRV